VGLRSLGREPRPDKSKHGGQPSTRIRPRAGAIAPQPRVTRTSRNGPHRAREGWLNSSNKMRNIASSLALVAALGTIVPAAAEDCDLQRAHRVCVPNRDAVGSFGQFLDRVHRAVDRALTPPGGWQQNTAVPPEPVPPAPPAPTTHPLTQQQWKDAIIVEAERFCAVYATDPVCHFKDQTGTRR